VCNGDESWLTCVSDCGALVFQAEAPFMGHDIGRAEADGWAAATGPDARGFMLFGPYTREVPAGSFVVSFVMQVDNNSADNLEVVTLDVRDASAGSILAQRGVRRRDFNAPNAYQAFDLPFVSPGASHQLEFRVLWNDYSYVRIDEVQVR